MTLVNFTPIYCGRSDGETEIRSKKYGKEYNGPSNDQLDKVANPDDYYETLDHDHQITVEWKRQLGVMLQREMRAQTESPWFLMFFPENYRLYKHHKGVRDNTDAYLYGYPQGRKKRFKTAQEFFPHFLWLMEGKSEDYGDCPCRNCAGDWVHKIEPLPGRGGYVPPLKEFAPPSRDPVPLKKEPVQVKRDTPLPQPKVVIQQRAPQQTSTLPRLPSKTPTGTSTATTANKLPTQPVISPNPLPPVKSREQQLDAEYRRYIYRIGELVWFNRGTAWGLAIVIKRDTIRDSGPQSSGPRARYLVQPLSHPYLHPESKLMTSNDSLRPWLAWSAPGPTHRALTGKSFATVDWKTVLAGECGPGDAEVDGSIFAAKQLDESFSLLSPLANNTITTGERTYLAMYLGGEKIYVGDPVRLRINQGQDIMVVHQIIEKLKPNSTNINLASVYLIGDIYRFASIPFDPANTTNLINPHLPPRMKTDLEFRNSVTVPSKRVQSFWRIIQSSARLTVSDLKGRWYESSILLPILRTSSVFAADIQRGEITDVGDWINGRGDANAAAGKMGTRFRERLEALGKAVPPTLRLGDGSDNGEGGIEGSTGNGTPNTSAAKPSPKPAPATTSTYPEPQALGQQSGQRPRETKLSQYMDLDKPGG